VSLARFQEAIKRELKMRLAMADFMKDMLRSE
jgi:hypothetical protein